MPRRPPSELFNFLLSSPQGGRIRRKRAGVHLLEAILISMEMGTERFDESLVILLFQKIYQHLNANHIRVISPFIEAGLGQKSAVSYSCFEVVIGLLDMLERTL